MRLLLDTHVFIWSAASPATLAPAARRAIQEAENEVFVSAAVAWEIAIKYALGRITLPLKPESWVPSRIAALGFKSLPISQNHALAVLSLPNHHNDPFDRIMVAQAQIEGLALVSRDERIRKYPVRTLRA
jgi:PIN domain nuclease of toxin-antitoxin system